MTTAFPPLLFILMIGLLGFLAGPASFQAAQRMLPALEVRGSLRTGLLAASVTAGLFVLMAWRFGVSWVLPALLFFSVAGVVLSRIDLQLRLLPNRIVVLSLGIGLALLILDTAVNHRWINLLAAFLGAAATFLIYLLLAVISPRGMGMGDVKFSALLGLYLGYLSPGQVVLGILLGFLVGALSGLFLYSAGLAGRKTSVAFGPAMFAGGIAAIAFGPEIGSIILPTLFS